MSDRPDYVQSIDELRNMTWRRVHGHLTRLHSSVYTFDMNSRELVQSAEFLCNPDKSEKFTRLRHRDILYRLLLEFVRQLHNTVAAAMSLVDHSRRVNAAISEEGHSVAGYCDRVDAQFGSNATHQVIQGLRNSYLHYEMLDVHMTVSFDGRTSEIGHALHLPVERLLRSKRWKQEAVAYLKSSGERLDVMQVIKDYREQVRSFYTWFESQVRTVYQTEIRDYEAKEQGLLLGQLREVLAITAFDGSAGKSLGEEVVFHTVLGSEDFAALESLPDCSEARADRALELLQSHLELPEEVQEAIRSWYSPQSEIGDAPDGAAEETARSN